MESNGWLVLVTAGLTLDICGVIILILGNSKSLFTFQLNAKRLRKRSKQNVNNLTVWASFLENVPNSASFNDLPKLIREMSTIHNKISVLQYEISHLHKLITLDIMSLRKESLIPIIILITGFLLQILGNWIKH